MLINRGDDALDVLDARNALGGIDDVVPVEDPGVGVRLHGGTDLLPLGEHFEVQLGVPLPVGPANKQLGRK